jgi:hypothetical protein
MRPRRNHSENAIDGTTRESGVGKRASGGSRGLGPFSGGQLTIIIVTFAVLLLVPVGAWAVTSPKVVTVDGVTRPADPPDLYAPDVKQTDANGCVSLEPTPEGKVLVVTSVHLTNATANPMTVGLSREFPETCTNTGHSHVATKGIVSLPAGTTVEVPFPSGLVITEGWSLVAHFGSPGGWLFVNGYLLPSSYCPSVAVGECLKSG